MISSSYIPTPKTIFREVQKLSPGQLLSWKEGRLEMKPYWDMSFRRPSSSNREKLSEELRASFSDAVRVRYEHESNPDMIGAFLSGGIDSSTVLGVLTQFSKQPIKSFSIGFGEEAFNETKLCSSLQPDAFRAKAA